MPKIFNEMLNQWVYLPEKPKRIVSLAPSITDILVELGLIEKIVGVSRWCTPYLKGTEKPVVASVDKADYEFLEKLKPDLILTTSGIHLKLARELHSKGYSVFPVQLPRNVFEIVSNILLIGTITSKQRKARELATQLIFEMENLRTNEKIKKVPDVYAEVWPNKFYITFGGLAFTNDFIHLAGGHNIFSERPLDYFTPDFNEVEALNPDVMIFIFENREEMEQTDILSLTKKRGWEKIKALKTGKMIIASQNDLPLTHSGPSFINTIKMLNVKFKELGLITYNY